MIRQTFERFTATAAFIGLITSYVGFVNGVVRDPYFVFWLGVLCSLIAIWHCIATFIERDASPSEVIAGRSKVRASRTQRILSVILLLSTMGGFASMLWWEAKNPFATVDISPPTYQHAQRLVVKLPGAETYGWLDGDYQVAPAETVVTMPDGKKLVTKVTADQVIPRALAFDGEVNFQRLDDMMFDQEFLEFSITKRYRVPWVKVKAVRVVVDSYHPLTLEPEMVVRGHVVTPSIYYARVAPTEPNQPKSFAAVQLVNSEVPPRGILIDEGVPEPIIVFVLPEKSGIYEYHIELDLESPLRGNEPPLVVPGRRFFSNAFSLKDTFDAMETDPKPAPIPEAAPAPPPPS
ncbi:hypothetical protein K2X85_18335 [bacterium]|nr:hypothetical protein [bacterium]